MGGATSVEGYYTLQTYLKNHDFPQCVILSFSPYHLLTQDSFWTRTMYFHYLSKEQEKDFFDVLSQSNEQAYKVSGYVGDRISYNLRLPHMYATSLIKSISGNRKKENLEAYNTSDNNKGRYLQSDSTSNGAVVNRICQYQQFVPNEINVQYLYKTIDLLYQYGIEVIIEQTPYSEATYNQMSEIVKKQINEFYQGIRAKYSEAKVNCDAIVYEVDKFSDGSHLNNTGAAEYSNYIKEKYVYLFQ